MIFASYRIVGGNRGLVVRDRGGCAVGTATAIACDREWDAVGGKARLQVGWALFEGARRVHRYDTDVIREDAASQPFAERFEGVGNL